MRNIYLVLACLSSVTFATAASYELLSNKERGINERGDGKDGRGVGGGYGGGQVGDAFSSIGIDIDTIVNGPKDTRAGTIYSTIPGSDDADSINLRKIVDFIESGNIEYAKGGEMYLGEGSSFAYVDGKLYMNQDYWEQRLLKPGYEVELIYILLIATEQREDAWKDAAEIFKKIESYRASRKTLEDYEKTNLFWD